MREYLNYCFWVFWHISPIGVQDPCFCEQNRFDVANSAQIVHFSRLHNFSSNSYFNLILEPLWTFVYIFYTWVLYGFLLVLLYFTVLVFQSFVVVLDASLHRTGYIHCLVWGTVKFQMGISRIPESSFSAYLLSGYHADTPITIKAEASSKADSRPN